MPPGTIITTQLVHLDGPRKGQIDEFKQDTISIGRDPGSDVLLPADLLTISRHHAELKREGNRFQLINKGRNRCMLNGQSIDEAWLKSGDVITLAEGGPKLSFLSRMETAPGPAASSPPPPAMKPPAHRPAPIVESATNETTTFTLQYGIQIRTIKQQAVKIGQADSCDFVIQHPKVCQQHTQLIYTRGNYFARDLSGSNATRVNQRVIQGDVALQNEDVIQLGEQGPELKFVGDGRFIELIHNTGHSDSDSDWETELLEDIETHKAFSKSGDKTTKRAGNLLSRLFKRR